MKETVSQSSNLDIHWCASYLPYHKVSKAGRGLHTWVSWISSLFILFQYISRLLQRQSCIHFFDTRINWRWYLDILTGDRVLLFFWRDIWAAFSWTTDSSILISSGEGYTTVQFQRLQNVFLLRVMFLILLILTWAVAARWLNWFCAWFFLEK